MLSNMRNKNLQLSILAVGLALATAWAVRGRFGHEQGAAWAGAIGALCLVLAARRRDWYAKVFQIAFAGAVGWGISGMMSYGLIVGYGRANDFGNAFYGLLMLFVIGVLYGIIGGGLVGLSLLDSRQQRIPWATLFAEMVAFALLTYGLIINQLEWFMTPPRSELWACGLGASIALIWFVVRNGYENVLKTAMWAALGAGFGFALGNFIQVVGAGFGIKFNFWNVMEYLIGLGGGAGMAYGVFTSSWPEAEERPAPRAGIIPLLFVALFVPFVVWDQSFVTSKMKEVIDGGGSESVILLFKLLAILGILGVTVYGLRKLYSSEFLETPRRTIATFFALYTGLYIFLSFLVTGYLTHPPEQYLYIVNLVAILWLLSRTEATFEVRAFRMGRWTAVAFILIVIIAVLAFAAIHSHEGLRGSNMRFVIN
jgi:hypothetical protein